MFLLKKMLVIILVIVRVKEIIVVNYFLTRSSKILSPMKKITLIYIAVIFFEYARTQLAENNFSKCCQTDTTMKYENSSYVCGGNGSSHVKIINNDLSVNISELFCVEVFNEEIFVFEKVHDDFTKVFPLSSNFYQKCCPLGYIYNARFHSCDEDEIHEKDIFGFRFIRIGLPKCKIILDYITHGLQKTNLINIKTEDYCMDKTEDAQEVIRVCTNDFGVCKTTKCIHKCCPDGYSFVNGSHCRPTFMYGVDLNFSDYIDQTDDFGIIHGYTGKIYLQPLDWEFHLDSKGVFRLFDEKIGNEIYGPTEETYCIEHATQSEVNFGHRLFRKYFDAQIEYKYIINGYVMIISCVFLLLTILCYIFLGETRKLFGKTLVSFCVSLILNCVLLIYGTFNLEDDKENSVLCRTFGFLELYAAFSTFLWLKLLCFDIYYTFGSGKIRNEPRKKNNIKRFLFYSLYGWGLSLLLTGIPLGLLYVDILPEPIQIKMGIYRCAIERFDGNYAEILFRVVPVTIILIINHFLFFKTIQCCMKVKNEISRMKNLDQNQSKKKFLRYKERFMLVIKLSVIMGVSYVFEVVSSFYDFSQTKPTKYLEIIWDIFNCMQGVFIFIIFICKRKIANDFKTHASVQKLRKISFSSGATLTTNISFDKDRKKKNGITTA